MKYHQPTLDYDNMQTFQNNVNFTVPSNGTIYAAAAGPYINSFYAYITPYGQSTPTVKQLLFFNEYNQSQVWGGGASFPVNKGDVVNVDSESGQTQYFVPWK